MESLKTTSELLARTYPDTLIRNQMPALLRAPALVSDGGIDTALHRAVVRGNYELTALFLSMNADPNVIGDDGNTPLHNACLKGLTEVSESLLRRGADPRMFSSGGTTPMHDAAVAGNVQIVSLLLARGASREDRTRNECQTVRQLCT